LPVVRQTAVVAQIGNQLNNYYLGRFFIVQVEMKIMKKFKQLAALLLMVAFLASSFSCASKKRQGCPTFSYDLIELF
jgi:hypothetical protein